MALNRPVYGRTWWGTQWLQALTQIDFDNRLPRGRSYANRGAVRKLSVQGGQIVAQVQGSRPRPYDVTISVPGVGPTDAKRLLDTLSQDPGLIARLLNRDLDPSVLQTAQHLRIGVFPASWKDLQMHCSCPDWAVPCKHLAAVIYLLSQEIDGDPFLVFSLRGLDLLGSLQQSSPSVGPQSMPALPSAAELLFGAGGEGDDRPVESVALVKPDAKDKVSTQARIKSRSVAAAAAAAAAAEAADAADAAKAAPASTVNPSVDQQPRLQQLDFSTLNDLREPLWRLLSAQPVFFRGGDFRELAQRVMARVARQAQAWTLSPPKAAQEQELEHPPLLQGQLQLTLDSGGALGLTGIQLGGQRVATLGALLQALADVPLARLADLPDTLAALHTLRALALHLLAKGAVVPQVYAISAKHTGLRWSAAELDTQVRTLLQRVAAAVPPGLLLRVNGRQKQTLTPARQARLLLSLLLDHLLRASQPAATEKLAGDPVVALFFGSGEARFDGPGQGAMAGSIQAWLARLHLAHQPFVPVLQLEENAASSGFALSLAVAEETQPLAQPTALSKVLSSKAWQARRMAVLQTVAMLAEFHSPLNDYVRGLAKKPLLIEAAELPALLFEALPAMRLLGIRALLPRALERLLRPLLSMQIQAPKGSVASFLKADDIFSFNWKVAIGDEQLTPAEFKRLLGASTGIVQFRGQYVYLDPAELERLRARLDKPPKVGGAELLRIAMAGELDGAPVGLNAAAQKLLEQLRAEATVPLPKGLQATLRPYQARGYAWLWRNARLGLGSVIADDMGLGKTVQVIALLLRLKQDGALAERRALVVVPTSLLTNWQKEVARFAPGLSVQVFHGAKRELSKARPDVLLTTYGVARSEAALLKAMAWRVVVVDEAQNIKNAAAAQAKAVKSIRADSFVAMSGTPVENRLSEYWSIMDFAQPGYLGSATAFERDYATPIQTHRDAQVAERLRKVMAPFMLRRLKSDKSIISDLPDKVEQDQYCTLTPTQAALYESVVQAGLQSIAGESDTFARQGLVLQMILALKQVCNHPAQYLKQGAADASLSGKTLRLLDLLDEIHAAQQKVLVFTQFRQMGDLLQTLLRQRYGIEPQFLHGGVPRAKRDQMVERFQGERSERIFLLSLKAGGTGLNLTAASQVLHFDLWWNPAVEAQATDRAYRIGQRQNVQVHRFITRGTFEERINDMIRAKRELAQMAVGTGETWVGQLPVGELKALFQLA